MKRYVARFRILAATAAAAALLVACGDPALDGEPHQPGVGALETCAPTGAFVPERSLVVTDPVVLARFGLSRTLTALLQSAGAKPEQTPLSLFAQWMSTWGDGPGGCASSAIDPKGFGLVCPRPEAALANVDPFVDDLGAHTAPLFAPIALVNRFDLAPPDGAHCGEQRIVYAMNRSSTRVLGRAFLIFEAVMENQHPELGLAGCADVAAFWRQLSSVESAQDRADLLDAFFYGGLDVDLPAVVRAEHYGMGASSSAGTGQIRTNMFVDFAEWNLREFRLSRTCNTRGCTLKFRQRPVASNPAEELFARADLPAQRFQTRFLRQLSSLAAPELAEIKMSISASDNAFESVADSANDETDYAAHASSAFREAIQARLTRDAIPLSVDETLRRATTQTCAGCHFQSSGVPIGGGQQWPTSLGFVHIDEFGSLSPALTDVFLPHRQQNLDAFLADHCSTAATAGAGG